MTNIGVKRYNVVRNFIVHSVNEIIKHCMERKIGNIVVGDWEDMKRDLWMRKKTSSTIPADPLWQIQDEFTE